MGCVSIYKIELHEVQHCLQVTVIRACNATFKQLWSIYCYVKSFQTLITSYFERSQLDLEMKIGIRTIKILTPLFCQ